MGSWPESRGRLDSLYLRKADLMAQVAEVSREIVAEIDRLRGAEDRPLPEALAPSEGGLPVSLKARVFAFLGEHGDGKTVAEIAAGIMEQDIRRVDLCLRDARSKKQLLEKPLNGRWTRTDEGKKYSRLLLGQRTVWDELQEEDQ